MFQERYYIYIIVFLLLTITLLSLMYYFYYLPQNESTLDEKQKKIQEQEKKIQELDRYKDFFEKAKEIEKERISQLKDTTFTRKNLVNSDDNCIQINGNTISFSECESKINQTFELDVSGLLKTVDNKCLVEKDNKVELSTCNNENRSQRWIYDSYPLNRYRNKESKRCMISTGRELNTGMCSSSDIHQRFLPNSMKLKTKYKEIYGFDKLL